jgi:glycosyltransferase involved in cell wall biosynthesis
LIRPKSLTSLSITFLCYNEEANVASMIEQCVKTADSYGMDYEIVVVDDGSRDRTAEIVRKIASQNPRVRLIQHEHNMGYGAAVRTCLKNAKKDLVFFTDGDNQFQLTDIDKLFSRIDDCDVVAGYRLRRQDTLDRRIKGRLWTFANKVLFQIPVRDVDCAFKLFRRKTLDGLELKSNQLLIHAEVIARLKRRGWRIQEIGIPHHPRTAGKATATGLGRTLKTFAETARLFLDISSEKRK